MAESTKGKDEELEWVMLRQEIKQSNPPMESLKEKIIRKTKANPLVPVGQSHRVPPLAIEQDFSEFYVLTIFICCF